MFTVSKDRFRLSSLVDTLRNYAVPVGIGFIVLVHLVGALGMFSPFKDLLLSMTPLVLLLDLILLLAFHKDWNKTSMIAMLGCGALGFALEVVGVHTGVLFGEYTYGPVLGLKLFNVPLIIGINWLLLIYVTGTIAGSLVSKTWKKVFIASFLMVMIDLLIEPVAIQYDYWSWSGGTIPTQNFVAWFLISAVMLTAFYKLKVRLDNRIAFALYLVLVSFFGILNII